MILLIDPERENSSEYTSNVYVQAMTQDGVKRTVDLSKLTRQSLLNYVRETGAEKTILHLLGYF